jgi:DUF3047 family protein
LTAILGRFFMKRNVTLALFAALTLLSAAARADGLRNVEEFSQYEVDKFPKSFRTYPFQRGKAEKVYIVKDDGGNKFLHASDDQGISVQAFKRFYWDRNRWPNFSWRWKAVALPKGGDERNGMPNDSACGIYLVFGGYTGNAIKYVWSSTLPTGTVVEKKPGKFYIVVLDSGSSKSGAWQTKTVNILEDYKKLFKSDPEHDPDGFGLLTDSNATHTPSACDYDDFRISETPF